MRRRATIVVVLLVPVLLGSGRTDTCIARIRQLESALEFFRFDNGRYPTTQEGLQALVSPPEGLAGTYRSGGYLQSGQVPTDPWGNQYRYVLPGKNNTTSFDLWSFGADGVPGGQCVGADIGNWKSPPPSIFDCPRQNPTFLVAEFSVIVTGALGLLALACLGVFRSVEAMRHERTWLSVLAPPPVGLAWLLAAAFLIVFVGLCLVA